MDLDRDGEKNWDLLVVIYGLLNDCVDDVDSINFEMKLEWNV